MTEIIKEIEQDLEELKLLSENMPESAKDSFRRLMQRRVEEIRKKLDILQNELSKEPVLENRVSEEFVDTEEAIAEEFVLEESSVVEEAISANHIERKSEDLQEKIPAIKIVGEKLNRDVNLQSVLSLNDSFRFSRELFENDKERMQSVLAKVGTMNSLEAAEVYLAEENLNRENEAYSDLMSILEKYFS
ncbi:hypothetical protein [Bacteroides sp. 224]|uniref:hypothetical protein n=1 Tax=Bacteroides sp. 224 TaxID=2302936 RepID=UPI0013D0219D|nr:hypothetical protein [Bacteroides sp. 224]NDV65291.1 hypothetical protein [Bacteroides sp. 224]